MAKVIIAEDPNSKAMLALARKAAMSHANVLITGETGVGKEVIAHYIHEHSVYSQGPFVSVNCAALPDNMIESILFGYEKGAFTSAINHYIGKFEQAQNGTLLLDEISEIPIELQAKLLRVLQEREIERLGGKNLIKINVRIIAATNKDLAQQLRAGLFRKDLYYRLNVLPLHCLPLKERLLDIVPLAEYFIEQHAQSLGRVIPKLTVKAKQKLLKCPWPGNIRELDNVIQRSIILTENDDIDEHDILMIKEAPELLEPQNATHPLELFTSKLEASEAKVIMDVLHEVEGQRNVAARKLNISPRTLRYKISKLKSIGIKVP